MGFSSLCDNILISPNKTSPRKSKIDSVAIHCMAGVTSAYSCGLYFQNSKVMASANYGIGNDGDICGYVDEDDAAWTTSNTGVDNRSITIEVSNSKTVFDWPISDAAYSSLIKLLVDICDRHNLQLKWANDKDYAIAASKGGPVDNQNMFVHRWFSAKACPGDYLFSKHSQIAQEVNSKVKQLHNPSSVKSKIIFVGDSRTSDIRSAVVANKVDDSNVWMCKSGAGLSWVKSNLSSQLESQVTVGCSVVFLIGLHDILSVRPNEYYDYLNSCSKRWSSKGVSVYYVSVNPVEKSGYNGITNAKILDFNQKVRNGLISSVGYIDSYSAVISSFRTTDKIHYDQDTSLNIYYCCKNLITATYSTSKVTESIAESKIRTGSTVKTIEVTSVESTPVEQTTKETLSDSSMEQQFDNVVISNYKPVDTVSNVIVSNTEPSLYGNSSTVGGYQIDVDYTKINPYIITVDRNTSNIDFTKLQSSGVVGAMLEVGELTTVRRDIQFKQPKFDSQRQMLDKANLPYGYFYTSKAQTVSAAQSEFLQFLPIIVKNKPSLGVWIKIGFSANSRKGVNDKIINYFQDKLFKLGFRKKIGFYTTKESLDKISWNKFQDEWLLWLIDHVENTEEIMKLLDPAFFDMDGK